MRFSIVIKGVKKDVDVEPVDRDRLKVKVDGEEYEVVVEGLEDLVALDRLQATGFVPEFEGAVSSAESMIKEPAGVRPEMATRSVIKGEIIEKEVLAKPAKEEASLEVRSPLPGIVSLVEVKEGGRVRRGDVLLYIESMKMLNEIVSPKDGTVNKVMKVPGDMVNVGDILVELKLAGE